LVRIIHLCVRRHQAKVSVKKWKDQMGNRASNLSIQELPPVANFLKDGDLRPYGYHYTTFGLEVGPVGLPRQAGRKACPGLPTGLKKPASEDHCLAFTVEALETY
jgi:hypothetical protein